MILDQQIRFRVSGQFFKKDPNSSELGRKILTEGISLIDELGFECFNFKKLASSIQSTEASIYRYFENKHKLLLYISAWYWNWMQYKLTMGLANIPDPHKRLIIAIGLLTEPVVEDHRISHINEVKLHSIIICEGSKCYLTKEVDQENEDGVFLDYKRVVQLVCDVILEINPTYNYPHMLVSTIIEGAHVQRHFADHLPRLTDTVEGQDAIVACYQDLALKALTS